MHNRLKIKVEANKETAKRAKNVFYSSFLVDFFCENFWRNENKW